MMQLIHSIYDYSHRRSSWCLLALTVVALEAFALYFQYILLLQPCVICIYQRCALLGILGAAVLGASAPRSPLRYAALALWIYSAGKGIALAWQQTMLQLHPPRFATCDMLAAFPTWLPLDKWAPAIFRASGDCSTTTPWQLLSLSMPQWMVVIFTLYLVVALVVLACQWRTRNHTTC